MPIFKYAVKGNKTVRETTAPNKKALLEMLQMVHEVPEYIIDTSVPYDAPPLTPAEMRTMGLAPELQQIAMQEAQKEQGDQAMPQQQQPQQQPLGNNAPPNPPVYRSRQGPMLQQPQQQYQQALPETIYEQNGIIFMLKNGRLYIKSWSRCDKSEFRVYKKNKTGQRTEITDSVEIEKLDWHEVPPKTQLPKE